MRNKRIMALLIACLMFVMTALTGCFEDEPIVETEESWSVYWYLCGSDLESDGAAATIDLYEMMEVSLPKNVNVIIQTGGAAEWTDDRISADKSERFIYNSEGFELIEQNEQANMGEADTLADFLTFCTKNYPADREAVIFWNHGGGSVAGAAFDENYDGDSLTLNEFYEAFDTAFGSNPKKPPLEMVGFDTCLMATVDTAYTFSKFAKYMVASEEYEPGGGWLYSGWLRALAKNPSMDGAALGKVICDTYYEGCEIEDVAEEATLSVTDLTKLQPLLDAYEEMGKEALGYALENVSFLGSFGREAVRSENYGGNTDEEGYTNMVDLGHLAENCSELLPEKSQAVIDALNDCIIYKVNGEYREYATGLSCYYSYNGDLDDFDGYKKEGYGQAFKYLYTYELEGELSQEGLDYVNGTGYEGNVPEVPDLEDIGADELPLYLDDEGFAVLELNSDIVDRITDISFYLTYVDEESDFLLYLGQDNDIFVDWESGVFKDNFRDVWGAIDGHLVYMEISYVTDNYTAYSVPILLNGEEYNLRVVYDYEAEEYKIIGARKGLDDMGKADKNLVRLKPGDEITTIHYAATVSGDDAFEAFEAETFKVTAETSFSEVDLGDGQYVMFFELEDIRGNNAYSQNIMFTVEGEYVTTEILD